jgi:tRNA(adenine34) deaminase
MKVFLDNFSKKFFEKNSLAVTDPKSLNPDENWMKAALAEAEKCAADVPVGCVIVRNNVIIAAGHNQRELNQDPTAHAEIIAIRLAAAHLNRWRLDDVCLYTTLEPCPMCAEALLQARVPRLVFGAYDIKSGAVGSAFNLYCEGRIYPLPEVKGGILEQNCQKLLIDFFKNKARSIK